MKPEQYDEYSKVFDTFSNPKIFPLFGDFSDQTIALIKALQKNSHTNIRVIDIGCGTGLFSKKIYDSCQNIELTLVEPSTHMLPILKNRFFGKKVKILEQTVLAALQNIPPQDIYIFQRSMYTFSGEERFYTSLEKQIYSLLNDNGIIAIYDFSKEFDVKALHEHILKKNASLDMGNDILNRQWQIFKNAQILINQEIRNGNFTPFSKKLRRKIFREEKYAAIIETYFYSFFQKE